MSRHAVPCHSFGYRPLLAHAFVTLYHFLIGDEGTYKHCTQWNSVVSSSLRIVMYMMLWIDMCYTCAPTLKAHIWTLAVTIISTRDDHARYHGPTNTIMCLYQTGNRCCNRLELAIS